MNPEVQSYEWIVGGIVGGALIGTLLALKVNMTAMPQLVAILHSFVGMSAVLVAAGTLEHHQSTNVELSTLLLVELSLGSLIGAVTFTGSVIAFGKLQGLFSSNPVVFRGQHFVNLLFGIALIVLTAMFAQSPSESLFWALTLGAFVLGILLIIPIGGADMPVVVSMLNSYSGWAASATGFTLNNNLLITTGALVGSSGAILSYIMCKAMNRSFLSVILGGYGAEAVVSTQSATKKNIKSASPEDVSFVLENASKVIIVPGYGMAVAQAQHAMKDLFETLMEKGVDVRFAIHPVAGRMPGHMNVLLAESDIPYEHVQEMDEINSDFVGVDVVFVVGANDVVNPAAKTDRSSPLFGMPILDAYRARQVFVNKRSMKAGYSGVDNDLFYYDNCYLVFGDAKHVTEKLVNTLRSSE